MTNWIRKPDPPSPGPRVRRGGPPIAAIVLRRAIAGLSAALLAACGTAPHSASPEPATPAAGLVTGSSLAAWPCLVRHAARAVTLPVSPPVTLVLLGGGSRAVLFSDESDEDLCAWLPLGQTLAADGYWVGLYDYTGVPTEDLTAAADYLRFHGAAELALVGASEGAKTSVVVAVGLRPAPAAVVSLSAEAALRESGPVAPYAARLTAPTLFVTAAADPYGSTEATQGFYASAPAAAKRLLVVPGQAHGTALLTNVEVRLAVLGFLAAHMST